MNGDSKTIKATEIIGLPVITLDTGEEVEYVSDVLYDLKSHSVAALLVGSGGWFSEAKVINITDIHTIGTDAVMIPSASVIKTAGDFKENNLAQVAKDREYLRKTRMVTEQGEEIGKVTDVFFSIPSGTVSYFEVSEGLLEDAMEGRKTVNVADIITIGQDATIVRTHTQEDVNQQIDGGIKKAIENTKEDTKEAFDELKEDARIAADKTQKKYDEIKNDPNTQNKVQQAENKARQITDRTKNAVSQAKTKAHDKIKDDVVGKYLTKNVLADGDEVIGERGDMITREMLHQAQANHVETELYKYSTAKPISE